MKTELKTILTQFTQDHGLEAKTFEPVGNLWRIRLTDGGRSPGLDARTTIANGKQLTAFLARLRDFMEVRSQSFPDLLMLAYEENVDRHEQIHIFLGSVLARDISRHTFSKSPGLRDAYDMLTVLENRGME